MANIQEIKELRDMTGCGLSDCKKALEEANDNREEAVKILREKGLAKAAKKAGRIAAEGVVKAKVEGTNGVIVEINCETDFCAKSDKFLELVETIADTILANEAADVEALNNVTVKGGNMTVKEYMTDKIATIGENMNIRRFEKLNGTLIPYMHDGGRLGTIVKITTDKPDDAEVLTCAKNVALQATAMGQSMFARRISPQTFSRPRRKSRQSSLSRRASPQTLQRRLLRGVSGSSTRKSACSIRNTSRIPT